MVQSQRVMKSFLSSSSWRSKSGRISKIGTIMGNDKKSKTRLCRAFSSAIYLSQQYSYFLEVEAYLEFSQRYFPGSGQPYTDFTISKMFGPKELHEENRSLDSRLLSIGYSTTGNTIFLEQKSNRVYYNFGDGSLYRAAESFSEFVNATQSP